jgi:non-homologous end joining protein Ku
VALHPVKYLLRPEHQQARIAVTIIKAKTKVGAEPKLKDLGPAAPSGEISDLMERLRASLTGGAADRPESPLPLNAGREPRTNAERPL